MSSSREPDDAAELAEGRRARASKSFAWLLLLASSCAAPNPREEENDRGYRLLPPLCLPCGDERSLGIVSSSELEQVHSELVDKCGESDEAAQWRRKLDATGIDFEKEALVILWDWIGTQGTPVLHVDSPQPRLLTAEIRWDVTEGPALPVATAACFCFAADRSIASRVQVQKGAATVLSLEF